MVDLAKIILTKLIKLKPNDPTIHHNLGITLEKLERLDEAETNHKKAIELKPDFAEAHHNLGVVLDKLGRLIEAEVSYKKAIELKPDFAEAHLNLGIILDKLNRLDDAVGCYEKSLENKPDYSVTHFFLGFTLKKQEKFEKAEASYKKAIELKPDFVEAHNNLGSTLFEYKSDLIASLDSYKKAINIKPDNIDTWHNLYTTLQTIKSQTSSIDKHLSSLGERVNCNYSKIIKSILGYRLNQGSPSSNDSLNEALKMVSSAENTFIKNPKIPTAELIKKPTTKKVSAMVHFGRSGTGLLHSLIDGHSEVSTLPSIFFSEFFDHFTWEKIIAGGWEEMADRFTRIYAVLFDASSPVKILTKANKFIHNIGKKEGLANVGIKKNEVLSLDKKKFVKELKQLMNCYDRLDAFTFFKLIHSAYENVLQNHNEKKIIFYHIHNPGPYAQLNFLRLAPNTNWLMMVREPLQSCESWIKKDFYKNNYRLIASRIFQMLFEVDQTIFQNYNSIGVRLEDLKEHPKKTISALCKWLEIKEEDSLYQMTAQGKKWWGDPSSPDFANHEDPFGKNSINSKLGSVFSNNDQFILRTLFYPFSVRFGYVEENLEKFKSDLTTIRPMLDKMFDFEIKIAQNIKMNKEKFKVSGYYLFLRSGMIERWNTLNKFKTYPNMLTPIKIN